MDNSAWEACADNLWDVLSSTINRWDTAEFDPDLSIALHDFVNHWNTLNDTDKSVHALSNSALYNLVRLANQDK